MWLKSPVYEEPRKKTPKSAWERKSRRKAEKTLKGKQTGTLTKPTCGTPQGGVISPLLSNLFLHQLDKAFHAQPDSPYYFANARLIRYADDFVVQARYVGYRIIDWIEHVVEEELKLNINREKTKVVKVKEIGQSLDFLGFTMRNGKDLFGRDRSYLKTFPSAKATERYREKIRGVTHSGYKRSMRDTIATVNKINRGWKNYF